MVAFWSCLSWPRARPKEGHFVRHFWNFEWTTDIEFLGRQPFEYFSTYHFSCTYLADNLKVCIEATGTCKVVDYLSMSFYHQIPFHNLYFQKLFHARIENNLRFRRLPRFFSHQFLIFGTFHDHVGQSRKISWFPLNMTAILKGLSSAKLAQPFSKSWVS